MFLKTFLIETEDCQAISNDELVISLFNKFLIESEDCHVISNVKSVMCFLINFLSRLRIVRQSVMSNRSYVS